MGQAGTGMNIKLRSRNRIGIVCGGRRGLWDEPFRCEVSGAGRSESPGWEGVILVLGRRERSPQVAWAGREGTVGTAAGRDERTPGFNRSGSGRCSTIFSFLLDNHFRP